MRLRVLKHRVTIAPDVFWYVQGRMYFDRSVSDKIKSMWKIGNYGW